MHNSCAKTDMKTALQSGQSQILNFQLNSSHLGFQVRGFGFCFGGESRESVEVFRRFVQQGPHISLSGFAS